MERELKLALICFFVGISLIAFIVTLPGCRTAMPAIDAQFWAGDSAKGGITRAQEQVTLECYDPRFDEYVCLTYEDLRKIYETMLKCRDWSGVKLMTSKQAKRFFKANQSVTDRIFHENSKSVESVHY